MSEAVQRLPRFASSSDFWTTKITSIRCTLCGKPAFARNPVADDPWPGVARCRSGAPDQNGQTKPWLSWARKIVGIGIWSAMKYSAELARPVPMAQPMT